MEKITPKPKELVDFVPAKGLVNAMIGHIMGCVDRQTPQEVASYIASNVAALAFVMCDSNDVAHIKELFSYVIDDASKQYEARKKAIERENANVLRFDPNG